jgi:enoyl-CoA hydratase
MLSTERHDNVTVITLRHGKVHVLDLELVEALTAAVRDVAPGDPVVLTGTGRAFSAGVDLKRIADGGAAYARQFYPWLAELFLAVFDHPGPVVAAVNGHALAGGCVLAAACDYRLMSQGTIGLVELSAGVPFPTSAVEIVRGVAGGFTSRLVLSSAGIPADSAHAIGLIDELVAPEALLETALAHAARLARVPPEVYALTKRLLQGPARERIAAALPLEPTIAALWASDEVMAAIRKRLEQL